MKTGHLLYIFSSFIVYILTSFYWWLILSFTDEFFIVRRESVVCKKYTNTNGKDCKDTKAIDISITGSCGGGDDNAGSFIACIASISATFFWII